MAARSFGRSLTGQIVRKIADNVIRGLQRRPDWKPVAEAPKPPLFDAHDETPRDVFADRGPVRLSPAALATLGIKRTEDAA